MYYIKGFPNYLIFKRLAMVLIRLRIWAGWSEPLLVAHTTLLKISCHDSTMIEVAVARLNYDRKDNSLL